MVKKTLVIDYELLDLPNNHKGVDNAYDILFSLVAKELSNEDLYEGKEMYGDKTVQNS